MAPYLEQFERVKRFLQRVRDHSRDSVEYDDDLWSFFQNAWHLKDWIKYDPSIGSDMKKRMLAAAESEPNLQICSDLANRSKHYDLRNERRGAKVTSRDVKVVLGPSPRSESTHHVALNDGSLLTAQELAERVFVAWEKILHKEGLV